MNQEKKIELALIDDEIIDVSEFTETQKRELEADLNARQAEREQAKAGEPSL